MLRNSKFFDRLTPALLVLAISATAALAQDPPSRVARLNYIDGNVSMEPSGVDQWAPAMINRPYSTGDYLYADQGAVAELHLDDAVIRLGQQTNFGFLNLNDQTVQLKMTEGDMYFRIHNFGPNQVFEVDTPNAAITLLREGVYRIHVDPNANTSYVFTRSGEAEVTGGGQAFTLNPGNSANLSGTDQLAFDIEGPPAPDSFDNWCGQREAHEAQIRPDRYVPQSMVGSEDLDDYGGWSQEPQYGSVWYPRSVPEGWAPYHNGHWAWIEPWGWTWVDDAPWGFAPFHYGRWVYGHDRWGWTPGPGGGYGGGFGGPAMRPVYAPAMVAWFGGSHWGVSISIGGGGPSLGWVPLGYGEVYTPSYNCSRNYFNNVNVNNTRITNTTNITNVYNNTYVNKTVYNQTYVNMRAPNAVTAMPQSAFASGRPANQPGYTVPAAQLARFQPAQASVIAPPVAPTRQALSPTLGQRAAQPPAQLAQRQVIAKVAPPPQPASFAARQSFLQQHVGQPHDFAAMRQVAPQRAQQVAVVSRVPAGQPMVVHQGQRVGNISATAAANSRSPIGQQASSQPQNRPGSAQQQPIPPPGGSAASPANYPVTAQHPVAPQPPVSAQQQRVQPPAEAQTRQIETQPAPAHGTPPHGTPPSARPANSANQPAPYNAPRPVDNVDRRNQPAPVSPRYPEPARNPVPPANNQPVRTAPPLRSPEPIRNTESPQPRTEPSPRMDDPRTNAYPRNPGAPHNEKPPSNPYGGNNGHANGGNNERPSNVQSRQAEQHANPPRENKPEPKDDHRDKKQ